MSVNPENAKFFSSKLIQGVPIGFISGVPLFSGEPDEVYVPNCYTASLMFMTPEKCRTNCF